MSETVALSHSSGASAEILNSPAGVGFNCIRFVAALDDRRVDVLDAPDPVLAVSPRPSGSGIPLLFPFPNRIREGTFTWDGQTYHVPLKGGRAHAIHGFCFDTPWRIVDRQESTATAEFQLSVDDPDRAHCWPADFLIRATYTLEADALHLDVQIENPDTRPLPWGFGTHAYFRLPLSSDSQAEDCRFVAPVTEQWELEGNLPTGKRHAVPAEWDLAGEGVPFGTVQLDDAFGAGEGAGQMVCRIVDPQAGLAVEQIADAALFRYAVIFTPPKRNALCLEPYTCMTDAINLAAQGGEGGLKVLPPGGKVETRITIAVKPL